MSPTTALNERGAHQHFKGSFFLQLGMRCTSSREPGWAWWALSPPCPSLTSTGTSWPWLPALHTWFAKFLDEFRPCPSFHPPHFCPCLCYSQEVTPSEAAYGSAAQSRIGHPGTPKDARPAPLPAPDWRKSAFFPLLEGSQRPMVGGTWQLPSAHPE